MTVKLYSKKRYNSGYKNSGFKLNYFKTASSKNLNRNDSNNTDYNHWTDSDYWLWIVDNNVLSPDVFSGDYMSSVKIDSNGDIVALGQFEMAGIYDIKRGSIFKFNSSGTDLGHIRLINNDEASARDIRLYGLAIDSSNNIYAAGAGQQFSYGELAFFKFNSSGVLQWQKNASVKSYDNSVYAIYPTPGNEGFSENCIATDSSGNIYMVASSYFQTSSSVYAYASWLIKWNSSGAIVWQRVIKGLQSAVAVVVRGSDVYISGQYSIGSIFLARYNTSGTLAWQKYYTYANYIYISNGLNVDSLGYVYLTATYYNTSTSVYDTSFLIKTDSSGNIVWQRTLRGKSSDSYGFQSLSIDSRDNIYVCGYTNKNGLIVKYNSYGMIIWQRILKPKNTLATIAFNSISINANATSIYVCGYTNDITNLGSVNTSVDTTTATPGGTGSSKNNQIIIKLTADGSFPLPSSIVDGYTDTSHGRDNLQLSISGYTYTTSKYAEGIGTLTASTSTLVEANAATQGILYNLTVLTPTIFAASSLTIGTYYTSIVY